MKRIILICTVLTAFNLNAQNKDILDNMVEDSYQKYYPEIGVFGAVTDYYGDVKPIRNERQNISQNLGFGGYLNLPISKFTLNLSYLQGAFGSEGNITPTIRNFKTEFKSIQLNFNYNFKKNMNNKVVPFIGLGANFNLLNTYSDLLDANGSKYYYWNNGLIKDLPQNYDNTFIANDIVRDYLYESEISDSVETISNYLAIPLNVGVKWRFSQKWNFSLQYQLNYALSDYIDQASINTGNDIYGVLTASVSFKIKAPSYNKLWHKRWGDVNMHEINNMDTDGDGVKDVYDMCAYTPDSVDVDSHGCPFDDDKDGVPNYLDMEKNSDLSDSLGVYSNGVSVKEEHLWAMYLLYRDWPGLIDEKEKRAAGESYLHYLFVNKIPTDFEGEIIVTMAKSQMIVEGDSKLNDPLILDTETVRRIGHDRQRYLKELEKLEKERKERHKDD